MEKKAWKKAEEGVEEGVEEAGVVNPELAVRRKEIA